MVWMGDEQVDKHLSTLSSLVFIPGWELQTKQPQLFCKQRIKIIYTLQSRRQGRWRWRWRWALSLQNHTQVRSTSFSDFSETKGQLHISLSNRLLPVLAHLWSNHDGNGRDIYPGNFQNQHGPHGPVLIQSLKLDISWRFGLWSTLRFGFNLSSETQSIQTCQSGRSTTSFLVNSK